MRNEYQLGKDIQALNDKLTAIQAAIDGGGAGVRQCPRCGGCHPRMGRVGSARGGRVAFGNNPDLPDTVNLEVVSGGTVTAVGGGGDLPIVNNTGGPVLYTAGQVAISVPSGQMASFNKSDNAGIVVQPCNYSYYDPCYPGPPNPDTICIIQAYRNPIGGAQTFFAPGDALPAGVVHTFNSNGTITKS